MNTNLNLSLLNTPEGRLRVLSAAVLAPMVIGVICMGGAAYAGLIALVAATGLFEWLRLVDPEAPKTECYGLYGSLLFALLMAAIGATSLSFIVIAMATVIFYMQRSQSDSARAYWFAAGLPYMAGSALALIYLRATPAIGLSITAYLYAVVWGMDIGAYAVGRLVGGPKLAPEISPNKTWSGFYGGIGLAVILSSVVTFISHAHHFWRGLLIAVILAAIAQAGDLFKSYFKRRAGVKDCGNIIPGHGGVLDRVDGLAFSAAALAFLQIVFGNQMIW